MDSSVAEQLSALWNTAISRPTMRFAEAIPELIRLNVQRYHADFVARTITAYVDHQAYTHQIAFPLYEQGGKWNVEGILVAGKLIEEEKISYYEFVRTTSGHGVTDYWVFIHGQKAVFMGGLGEVHVSDFAEK